MIREAIENDLIGILKLMMAILNTTSVYDYKAHTIYERKEWYEKEARGISYISI